MSKPVDRPHHLENIFARIQTGVFMTIVVGLLVLTLASTLGHEAIRTILLGTLTIVFVLGGGLLGMVSMHHLGQTHLPETQDDQESLESSEQEPVLPRSRRARGFLGLFALEPITNSDEPPPPQPDFRRST